MAREKTVMEKIVAFLFFLLSLSAGSTYALDTLRCGQVIVSIGDHKTDVYTKCGDPIQTDERIEYLIMGDFRGQLTEHRWVTAPPIGFNYLPVHVEEWIYNFGPQRFMQLLRFEDSILKDIRSLGYGY
jgi:hypothetical protein